MPKLLYRKFSPGDSVRENRMGAKPEKVIRQTGSNIVTDRGNMHATKAVADSGAGHKKAWDTRKAKYGESGSAKAAVAHLKSQHYK